MTQTPEQPDEHQDLLARILTGELDAEQPEVAARLRHDPALRRKLDELLELAGELDGACAPQVPSSSAEPWPGADAAMRTLVRERLCPANGNGPTAGAGGPRRFWPVLLLAAAAAAVVVGVWLWQGGQRLPLAPPTIELTQGGTAVEPQTVKRDQLAGLIVTWTFAESSDFEVRVTAATSRQVILFEGSISNVRQWTMPDATARQLAADRVEEFIVTVSTGGGLRPPKTWTNRFLVVD